jgi:hypothetical protein
MTLVVGEPRCCCRATAGAALDRIHLGHRHLMKKAPGVGRNGFKVAPLGLRIQRPIGERRLSRSRHAGEDNQGVAGNLERDVLEIVLAGSANPHEAVVDLDIPSAFTADQQFIHPNFLGARAKVASLSIRKSWRNHGFRGPRLSSIVSGNQPVARPLRGIWDFTSWNPFLRQRFFSEQSIGSFDG